MFDPTTLKVKSIDTEKAFTTKRGRQAMPNPFVDVLAESFTTGKAKAVTVPHGTEKNERGVDKNVVTVLGLIRRAASDQSIGVRIETVENEKNTEVRFLGVEKRARKPRESDGTTANTPEPETAPAA